MRLIFALPILLLGCNAEKETDSAITEEPFAPTEGTWKFEGLSYGEDGCNFASNPLFSVETLEARDYTLTNVSETEVRFVDDNEYTFECTRAGQQVTCPNTLVIDITTYNDADGNAVVDEQGNPVDPDATNTINTEFVSTYSTSAVGTLSASLTGSCEGADCEVVYQSFGVTDNPCYSSLSGQTLLQN